MEKLNTCAACSGEVTGYSIQEDLIFMDKGIHSVYEQATLSCGCIVPGPFFGFDDNEGVVALFDGLTEEIMVKYQMRLFQGSEDSEAYEEDE